MADLCVSTQVVKGQSTRPPVRVLGQDLSGRALHPIALGQLIDHASQRHPLGHEVHEGHDRHRGAPVQGTFEEFERITADGCIAAGEALGDLVYAIGVVGKAENPQDARHRAEVEALELTGDEAVGRSGRTGAENLGRRREEQPASGLDFQAVVQPGYVDGGERPIRAESRQRVQCRRP